MKQCEFDRFSVQFWFRLVWLWLSMVQLRFFMLRLMLQLMMNIRIIVFSKVRVVCIGLCCSFRFLCWLQLRVWFRLVCRWLLLAGVGFWVDVIFILGVGVIVFFFVVFFRQVMKVCFKLVDLCWWISFFGVVLISMCLVCMSEMWLQCWVLFMKWVEMKIVIWLCCVRLIINCQNRLCVIGFIFEVGLFRISSFGLCIIVMVSESCWWMFSGRFLGRLFIIFCRLKCCVILLVCVVICFCGM